LRYAAGVIGYGSEVIGFNDEMSTDHMWGPRFLLFQVLFAGRFAEAIRKVIPSAELKQLVPERGSVSQFTDSVTVFDDVKLYGKLKNLYQYYKWFGSAFAQLQCAKKLKPVFHNILNSINWKEREKHRIEEN